MNPKAKYLQSADSARKWLNRQGKVEFDTAWNSLGPLLFSVSGWPVGVTHIEHFNSLVGTPLAICDHEDLTFAYVCLAVAFFCMDRQFDGDKEITLEPIATPLFVGAAMRRIAAVRSRQRIHSNDSIADVNKLLETFFTSMIEERQFSSSMRTFQEEIEFGHVSNRSYIVRFFVNEVRKSKGLGFCQDTDDAAAKLVYYMQLGDDWGDWREDYRNKNWSTFLRFCAGAIDEFPASENDLEEFIYLSGTYEKWGAKVVNGLRAVNSDLRSIYGDGYENFSMIVERTIERGEMQIENFRRIKRGESPVEIPNVIQ